MGVLRCAEWAAAIYAFRSGVSALGTDITTVLRSTSERKENQLQKEFTLPHIEINQSRKTEQSRFDRSSFFLCISCCQEMKTFSFLFFLLLARSTYSE